MSTATLVPSGTSVLDWPRDRWLALRREAGVGASETPDLLGVGYGTPLTVYLTKLGMIPPVEETEAMRIGSALEPVVVDLYSRRVGVPIQACQVFVHRPDFPRAFATLDAVRADGRPVEVKVVGHGAAREWGDEDDGLFGVPARPLAQMAHQLLASGADAIDLVALFGTEIRVWTLTRDDAEREGTFGVVRDVVGRFVDRLDRRDPPPADHPGDDRHLVHLYPEAEGSIALVGHDAIEAANFLDLGAQIRALEALRKSCRGAVLQAMGEAAQAELPDGRRLARRVVRTEDRTQFVRGTTYADLREKKGKGADRGEE